MKHRIVIPLAIFLLISAMQAGLSKEKNLTIGSQGENYERSYQEGLDLLGRRELFRAQLKFFESIDANPYKFGMTRHTAKLEHPKNVLALSHENLAVSYLLQGNYGQVIKDTSKAIALKPGYSANYLNRALAYTKFGKLSLAQKDIQKAKQLDTESQPGRQKPNIESNSKSAARLSFLIRADIQVQAKEFQAAVADYSQVINLDPDKFGHIDDGLDEIYFRRASANVALKQYDKAIADYDQLLKFDAEDETAYIRRGDVYVAKKDYQHALSDYSKAIAIDPRNAATAYLSRAKVYNIIGKKDLANADRAAAQKQGRESIDRW